MGDFNVPAGEIVRLHFPVLDLDGITPLSGVLDGGWTKTVLHDGVPSAQVLTITEVGTSGVYVASFTPDEPGDWYVEAYEPTTAQLFACSGQVDVTGVAQCVVSYDQLPDLRVWVHSWLDRNGVTVTDPLSSKVTLYDKDGNFIFTKTAASPDAQGHFLVEQSATSGGGVDLTANLPWTVRVEITDARGTVKTTHGFAT